MIYSEEEEPEHGILYYIFDAVMPFLQVGSGDECYSRISLDYSSQWKAIYYKHLYTVQACCVSLQVYFRTYYSEDKQNYPTETETVNKLARVLLVRIIYTL